MKKKHLLLILLMTLLAPWAVAQQSLPYSYGFEDNDLSIDGWSLVGSTSSSTGINSVAKHNGTYGFQFYYSEHGAYLMSPQLSGTGTGLAVAFYYAEATNSYGDEQFYVGYTTDATNTDPTTFTYGGIETASVSWQLYENTLPANVQRIAIKYVYNDALKLYLDDFTFAVPTSCSKPSGLAATLTPGNGTKATLNWTAGGTETAWVLEYGTDATFAGATSVNVSGTPTKNLTGLTPETKYYARVKADCGGGEVSDWCNNICEFTPTNDLTITVNDGTTTNTYVPLYGYWADSEQRAEFIIPATGLSVMNGNTIKSMKFYPNYSYDLTGSFTVYLAEVSETTFSGTDFYTEASATTVYTGTVSISSDEGMKITFDGNYDYNGGNLLVGFYKASGGNYSPSSSNAFYGVTASGASISYYSTNTATQKNFLPKVTFAYETNPFPKPRNLTATNVEAFSATISWDAPLSEPQSYSYQYMPQGGEWTTLTSTTSLSANLTGLAEQTDYTFRVKAIYKDGESEFATKTFKTDIACYVPTDVYVDNIDTETADLFWTGDATANYDVMYNIYKGTNQELLKYDNGTCTSHIGTGSNNEFFWATMYPAGSFTGNYLTKVTTYDCGSMTGSFYVFNDGETAPDNMIAYMDIEFTGAGNFVDFVFDEPIGIDNTKNLWIVFDNESMETNPAAGYTETDSYPNNRWISFDGASWGDLADAGLSGKGWMIRAEVETVAFTGSAISCTGNTYAFTGLEPKTQYAAQVRKNCGGIYGESAWVNLAFTTLATCLPVENLTASNITAYGATFTWTAETTDNFQYCYFREPAESFTPADSDFTNNVTGNTITLENVFEADTPYGFYLRRNCGGGDYSVVASVLFQTDLSCYPVENLAVTDLAATHATLEWTSTAENFDLRYTIPSTATEYRYDDGVFEGALGLGGDSFRWGIMFPANTLGGESIRTVSIYDYDVMTGKIQVFNDGDDAPSDLVFERDITLSATQTFVDFAILADIDATKNVWVIIVNDNTDYPAAYSAQYEVNGSWIEYEGDWYSNNDFGYPGSWMITADVDDGHYSWVDFHCASTSYEFAPLFDETDYIAQVRANCGVDDGVSTWETVFFTTESACPAQDELAIEEVGTDYAIISWNAHGYDEGWNLRYSTDEATWIDITKEVTNPYTLADLTSNTKYYVQVQTKCNTDLWSSSLSFKTDCGVMTITPSVTIDEDFEGYTGTTYNTEGVVPDCWTSYSTNTTMPDPHIVGSGSYHYVHDGTNSLNFEANGGKNAYVALPEFTNDFEYLQVQFWMQTESSSSDYKLSLGYITAADNNYDTYQVIEEFEPNTGSMVYHVVYLGIKNVPAEATRLVFRWANSGSSFYACAIDDVFVGLAPAILPVGTLTYNSVQATSVKLSWELLDVTQDLWQVQYATDAGFTQNVGTADADTNENFLLEGLTAETHYYVRVRGQKEYQGYGDWSNTVDFETMPACSAANVTFENITHHNATVNWNGESSDGFTVYYSQATSFDPDHTVINEGFEAGEMPTGWTIEGDNQDASKTWRVGIGDYSTSTGTHSGNYNALITHNTKGNVTYLVTPTLDLSSLTNGKINVWYVNRSWSGDNDEFGVYYRVDGGAWNEIFATTDTHPTWTELFVNLPADALVANCQFGFKMTDNYGYGVGIDDIKVGQMLEATWQTKTTSSTTTDLTGLEAGTQYEVYVVPQCNPASHSATESFTTIASDQKYFLTAGDWATTTNWMDGEIPTITDNAIINANVNVTGTAVVKGINLNYNVLTVASGATLTINGTVTNGGSDKIIIEDGGQLIHNTSIYATVKKNITAPAVWKGTSDADGWYLIATPVSSTTISSTFDGTIDLFKYNEATAYWWSYNNGGSGGGNSFTTIDRGTGYLHASQTSQTVNYAGSMISTESSESIPLSYACSSTDVKGFNLVGNPFTRNLVLGDMSIGSNPVTTIYVIKDEDRTKLTAVTTDEYEVKPGEGFFVQATALNQMVKLNPSAKDEFEFRYIKIVAGNENGSDNAYIQLENGNTLNKMNIANKTSVYVVDGGENLAATTINELAGSMPVNFKATAEDVYTITINTKNIEASTMILLDNMTGEEIDLLATPSYSFKATPNDSEDRFRLIFDCNTYTGIDEFFTDEIFAFQSGSEIYVKGEGELQVFDVMGRMVLNTRINGVERVNVPANAVYIFKLEEKTQKIVVR